MKYPKTYKIIVHNKQDEKLLMNSLVMTMGALWFKDCLKEAEPK